MKYEKALKIIVKKDFNYRHIKAYSREVGTVHSVAYLFDQEEEEKKTFHSTSYQWSVFLCVPYEL
jgi:hypothetical protein